MTYELFKRRLAIITPSSIWGWLSLMWAAFTLIDAISGRFDKAMLDQIVFLLLMIIERLNETRI